MTDIISNGYKVCFEKDGFSKLNAFLKKLNFSSAFILCDENTMRHCLPILITNCPSLATAEIIEIESGENSKTINICALIWQTLLENKADKNAVLLNLGGGVVSDLGGFAASVFKRGISCINIPTSLLAMADASVGGKTALDFDTIKNAIGTFSQPKAVFIYQDFLKTLPQRHIKNGLVEIYKIALVSDKSFWQQISETNQATAIYKSITLKNKIVLKDPFDKAIRKILNFGHTIGHAIETLKLGSVDELLHGEAVLAGLIIESHLSVQKKLLGKKEYQEILDTLCKGFKLPSIANIKLTELMEVMANDKKSGTKSGIKHLSFSLISKIGACKTDVHVSPTQIKSALEAYQKLSND